jgi:hypothetical protein
VIVRRARQIISPGRSGVECLRVVMFLRDVLSQCHYATPVPIERQDRKSKPPAHPCAENPGTVLRLNYLGAKRRSLFYDWGFLRVRLQHRNIRDPYARWRYANSNARQNLHPPGVCTPRARQRAPRCGRRSAGTRPIGGPAIGRRRSLHRGHKTSEDTRPAKRWQDARSLPQPAPPILRD